MKCSLKNVNTLLLALLGAILIALAMSFTASPVTWAIGAVAAGAGAVLVSVVKHNFEIYKDCRDKDEGRSRCSDQSIQSHFAALSTLLTIAALALLVAVVVIFFPIVGVILAGYELVTARVALFLALAIVFSLGSFIAEYKKCRDKRLGEVSRTPSHGGLEPGQ